MNGVPMRFDYSKTINEQLPTFNYYKDRYASYELQILNLIKENNKLIEKMERAINYIDQVIMYKPCAKEIDNELNVLIGILKGE